MQSFHQHEDALLALWALFYSLRQFDESITNQRTDRRTNKATYRDARMHLKYGVFVNVRQNLTNGLTGLQGLLCDEIEVRQLGLPNHLLNFIWDSLWGLRFLIHNLYANV